MLLVSFPDCSWGLGTDHPELGDLDVYLMLQFIQQSPSLNLSLIAQCALKTTYWDAPEGVVTSVLNTSYNSTLHVYNPHKPQVYSKPHLP